MVWGVCCRLLHNHQDAEDAFQATFLVLVRKAADVPRQAVANWLYCVARQTAVRLRATAAKRGRREAQVVNMPEPTVAEARDADWRAALDAELSRLPDRYRGVVVLCDLEGMTRKEAARQLGIPEGSVASRLARARVMLAKRLTRRGVVLSGASVAAALSAGTAPPALVASTIKTASLLAAGRAAGIVSAKVAALTDGGVKAMLVTKIKCVLAGVLVVGLALGGAGVGDGLSTNPVAVAQQPGAKPDDGKKRYDTDWRIRVLDGQIAKLREVKKQTEQEAARLNEKSAAIERTIGELLAQRERFLKKPGEEKRNVEAKAHLAQAKANIELAEARLTEAMAGVAQLTKQLEAAKKELEAAKKGQPAPKGDQK
jgi:RNA polymerase sigma factor (sigma-70 family)